MLKFIVIFLLGAMTGITLQTIVLCIVEDRYEEDDEDENDCDCGDSCNCKDEKWKIIK